MAESSVTFFLEKLSNLVIQEASLFGVEGQVKLLRNELKWMRLFLKDADSKCIYIRWKNQAVGGADQRGSPWCWRCHRWVHLQHGSPEAEKAQKSQVPWALTYLRRIRGQVTFHPRARQSGEGDQCHDREDHGQ